ncbi:SDR family NAD(P)-dependent oxidoreductase, partial [Marinobacter nauticus]|uniref:SDR family NAD(P)-dependent oxidoreductase n=1 Tax=Marinobacter nauticus TaxID=2743 RepID=UPI0032B1C15C
MSRLQQRTVFITGGSRGIGRAIALACAREGANVVIAAKTDTPHPKLPGTIHTVAEEIRNAGGQALPLVLDVRDERQVRQRIDEAAGYFGGIDALVNNAGYGETGPVETMPIERERAMFEVNVFGLIGLTQMLLPPMRERRRGRIVNLSSIAGRFVTPGAGWYGASKHALEGISDALRLELHRFGVQVVLVEPGLIRTGFEAVSEASLQQQSTDPVWGPMMRRVAASWAEGFCRG